MQRPSKTTSTVSLPDTASKEPTNSPNESTTDLANPVDTSAASGSAATTETANMSNTDMAAGGIVAVGTTDVGKAAVGAMAVGTEAVDTRAGALDAKAETGSSSFVKFFY